MENDSASPSHNNYNSLSFLAKLYRGTTLPHSSNRVLQSILTE